MPENLLSLIETSTREELQEYIKSLMEVVASQAKQIALLEAEVRELKEKLGTNSKNSSKPTSQEITSAPKNKAASKRRPGGQKGHPGKGRDWVEAAEVDAIHDIEPPSHCDCGATVTRSGRYLPHQTIDLPEIKVQVHEYRRHYGICTACGRVHVSDLPSGVSPSLLESRLLAFIGTLTGGYRLSKRLVQSLLYDLFKLDLSLGLISQSETEISAALAPVVEEARISIQKAPIVHCDETGAKEKGQRQWLWGAVAGTLCVFMMNVSRGAKVAKTLLGEMFAGILITDRHGAYTWVAASRRQLCWAHLKRDFQKMVDRGGTSQPIGERLLHLLKRLFDLWQEVKADKLDLAQFQTAMQPIQAEFEHVLQEGSRLCDGLEDKTAATCVRLLNLKEALWTFVRTPGVEPTNNTAERSLRHYVMWRKISSGSQSPRGSLFIERIMTVVGSCKLQQRNVLHFLTDAITAHRAKTLAPSLVFVGEN